MLKQVSMFLFLRLGAPTRDLSQLAELIDRRRSYNCALAVHHYGNSQRNRPALSEGRSFFYSDTRVSRLSLEWNVLLRLQFTVHT